MQLWVSRWWLNTYSLFLYAVMLAYPVLLMLSIYGLLWALVMAKRWLQESPPVGPDKATAAVAMFLIACLIASCLRHIFAGFRALVTPAYEGGAEAIDAEPVTAEEQPLLYEFVESVAVRLATQGPDRIWISQLEHCFAAEHRRFRLTNHRKLHMVLGFPQLLVLTRSELAVIVAHELSHLAEGDARLLVFVYRFHAYLLHVIARMKASGIARFNPIQLFSVAYAGAFRVLAAPLFRLQELRADSRAAEALGGDLAVQAFLKEWLVEHQFTAAAASYGMPPDQETVFDRFARSWQEFSPSGLSYLRQRLQEEETPSFWDTHPMVRQRLDAMETHAPASDIDNRPASGLIQQPEELEQVLQRRFLDHLHSPEM